MKLTHIAGGSAATLMGVLMFLFRTMLIEAIAELGRIIVDRAMKIHARIKKPHKKGK